MADLKMQLHYISLSSIVYYHRVEVPEHFELDLSELKLVENSEKLLLQKKQTTFQ